MAWRSHGDTNDELVDKLAANGLINDDRVAEAMKKVPSAIRPIPSQPDSTTSFPLVNPH